MADIFNSVPGVIAVLEDEFIIPGRVHVEGFEPEMALISGIDYSQLTDHQFQTSLERKVYIYVFGDAMGEVRVHGLAFPALCDNIGGTNGLIEVLDYYKNNRASAQPTPVQVFIGSDEEVITGYLTAVQIRTKAIADDPSSFFSAWTMMINALPRT